MDALGLYLSVPFCRAKCSFCNFASDAFAPRRLPLYVDRLCAEIAEAHPRAHRLGADLPLTVDTLYFGGGTPSLLEPADVRRIVTTLRDHFDLTPDPEITVECAPNQLSPATLEELQRQGVNRLSFGVQSFLDRESAAIGRTHTARDCLGELDRVRSAGILNLSLDLIAGLPHQTEASWRASVEQAIATGVPHVSIYLLEVDDDSRLGREILSDGPRYGAPTVPSDDQAADFYELACDRLEAAGIPQYEISNFARPGFRSRHNLKYWDRQPYMGFGLDAHSMLRSPTGDLRFSNPGDLDSYLHTPLPQTGAGNSFHLLPSDPAPAPAPDRLIPAPTPVPDRLTRAEAFEETVFLGLRRNEGISLHALREQFGSTAVDLIRPALRESAEAGLLDLTGDTARLTARGRVLSNEVFSLLLLPTAAI